MSDYRNATMRFANKGLQISLNDDLVEDSKYIQLSNVKSIEEGSLTNRAGFDPFYSEIAAEATAPGTKPGSTANARNVTYTRFMRGTSQGRYGSWPATGVDAFRVGGQPDVNGNGSNKTTDETNIHTLVDDEYELNVSTEYFPDGRPIPYGLWTLAVSYRTPYIGALEPENFGSHWPPPGVTVNSVWGVSLAINYRIRDTTVPGFWPTLWVKDRSTSTYYKHRHGTKITNVTGDAFAQAFAFWATNPQYGDAWTTADLNNLVVGWESDAPGTARPPGFMPEYTTVVLYIGARIVDGSGFDLDPDYPTNNTNIQQAYYKISRFDEESLITGKAAVSAYVLRFFNSADGSAEPHSMLWDGTVPGSYMSGWPFGFVTVKTPANKRILGLIGDYAFMWYAYRNNTGDIKVARWGIKMPSAMPTVATTGTNGALNSNVPGGVPYDWRYTYKNSLTGTRSNPSEVMQGISVENANVVVTVTYSPDPQCDQIEIWRRGGSLGDNWRYVGETANPGTGTTTYTDKIPDENLVGNEFLELDNYLPFVTENSDGDNYEGYYLPFIFGPVDGNIVLACGDANRPGFVYWTNPGRPYSADIFNYVEVCEPTKPLVNGCIYNGQAFVFNRESMYALNYGVGNVTFSPSLTNCGRGLQAPWGLAVGPHIYFVSHGGIFATNGHEEAVSLTEDLKPIFEGETVHGFSPVEWKYYAAIRLVYFDGYLHFLYRDPDNVQQHLVMDMARGRWANITTAHSLSKYMLDMYPDKGFPTKQIWWSGTFVDGIGVTKGRIGRYWWLPGSLDGQINVIRATQEPAYTLAKVQSPFSDLGIPQTLKEFGNLILDADPGGIALTVKIYTDSSTSPSVTTTVTGSGRQKIPIRLDTWDNTLQQYEELYGHSISVEISWDSHSGEPVLYQMELLWRPDEEAIKHWEFPETAFTTSGWMHIRDGYIAMRSAADVTMDVTVDGNVWRSTIPSTGGKRRKVYVKLESTKGKKYRIHLSSNSSFRVYGEDCEFRVKQWNSSLGYQLLHPFEEVEGGT